MHQKTPREVMLARSLIKELGSQSCVAKLVGVRQPSVSRWCSFGVSRLREADLRVRFPNLEVWKQFPPQVEPRPETAKDS